MSLQTREPLVSPSMGLFPGQNLVHILGWIELVLLS